MSRLPAALLLLFGLTGATKPVLDLSNNMRHVLVPSDTKPGTTIYRLRASDADDHYPLRFRVDDKDDFSSRNRKPLGSSRIVSIENTDCSSSICSADVVLTASLLEGSVYRLSLTLFDTKGETTIVDAAINVTKPQTAFKSGPRLITVPEDMKPGKLLGYFVLSNNPELYRGVSCYLKQIAPPPTDVQMFSIRKDLTPVEGETRCSIYLQSALDYERVSSYILQIIGENAWTDGITDSRNVAVQEFIINVENIADTPPVFLSAPPITRLPESSAIGDFVLTVVAVDGDAGLGRPIRYTLDSRYSTHAAYFKLDSLSGRMTVKRNLQELEGDVGPGVPLFLRIVAQEVEEASPVQKRHNRLVDQIASVEIAIIVDDVINRPPRFLQSEYITNIKENAEEGSKLRFEGGLDRVEDLDKGQNGILELSIKGHEDIFEISPPIIQQFGQFSISIRNNKKLDAEKVSKLEFKIVAQETGSNKLLATADVIVNVIDINDSPPVFSLTEYRITIRENIQPGTKIIQVQAKDADKGDNGKVRYTRIGGDPVMQASLQLDQETGEITITDNRYFDRETKDIYVMTVEAKDEGGPGKTNVATARLVISIEDVNDVPPLFKRRKYEGFMTPDLTRLRNDLQVEAVDMDKSGTQNSDVRYEIIKGNYEKKFSIDEHSGVISVAEPLQEMSNGRSARDLSMDKIDPIITLHVRAYDMGIPSLDSEVPVNIFTQDVQSRVVKFIVDGSVGDVSGQEEEISDLLSTITGGEAEIQDIQPYSGQEAIGTLNIDRISERRMGFGDSKSVVDVFIRYPATSVVDVDAIKQKLVSAPFSGSSGRNGRVDQIVATSTDEDYLVYVLAILLAFLLVLGIIFLVCCCCPSCPCYRDATRNKVSPAKEDIQVLTVKDEAGKPIRDARFVEILKSARTRIKSASESLKSSKRREAWSGDPRRRIWKVQSSRGDDQELDSGSGSERPLKIKVIGDKQSSRIDGRDIYILQDGSYNSSHGGAYIVHGLDELDSSSSLRLAEHERGSGNSHSSGPTGTGDSVPRDNSKIFKVIDLAQRRHGRSSQDVQVLRIDEDTLGSRTEYMKVGNAEVLNLENGVNQSPSSPRGRYNQSSPQRQPQSIEQLAVSRPYQDQRRAHSDMDIYQNRNDPTELYTTIGPDGKEIILRRYLNDQADNSRSEASPPIGFVNQALGHLQQEFGVPQQVPQTLDPIQYYQQQREIMLYQQRADRSSNEQKSYQEYPESLRSRQESQLGPEIQRYRGDGRDLESYRGDGSDPIQPFSLQENGPDSYQDLYSQRSRQQQHQASNERQRSRYEQSGYESDDEGKNSSSRGQYSQHQQSYRGSHLNPVHSDDYDLTPKHKIRSPIIEETESTVEQELRSRGQSRRLKRFDSNQDISNQAEELKLSLSEQFDAPGPQYTETKSSILRRRNSKAKLNSKGGINSEGSNTERQFKRRRKYNSLNDLTAVKKNSNQSLRRRRNSISNDDIQRLKRSFRESNEWEDFNQSKRTDVSKKFYQYAGTSPKEKIEYADYTDVRENQRLSVESDKHSNQQPRRFTVLKNKPKKAQQKSNQSSESSAEFFRPDSRGQDIPSLEFTFDANGDIISNSSLDKSTSRKREPSKSDQMTTPRYMDWYTKQQQQQKELLQQRQQELQQQQLLHKHRMREKHRKLLDEQQIVFGSKKDDLTDDEDELNPDDSVSNHNENVVIETDDAKLRRLSTAEKRDNDILSEFDSSSLDIKLSVKSESEKEMEEILIVPFAEVSNTKTRPNSAEVLLSTK